MCSSNITMLENMIVICLGGGGGGRPLPDIVSRVCVALQSGTHPLSRRVSATLIFF